MGLLQNKLHTQSVKFLFNVMAKYKISNLSVIN